MNYPINKDERGIAHLALILLAVLVVAAVGFAGWRVMSSDKKSDSSLSSAVKDAAAKCDMNDKDLCKFMASWKENKYYTMTSTSTGGDSAGTMTMKVAGENSHISATGEYAYEMITIGNTNYTKDAADGKWWKQTFTEEQKKDYVASDDIAFEESSEDSSEPATTYKKIGKEACGKLTCFKYQVIDPSVKDQTDYIWFDDKDYQLRRMLTELADGSKTDMTFSYDKITISAPSPVKEVGENQVVVPGQSEPMDMPSEAELQQLMQQYGGQ